MLLSLESPEAVAGEISGLPTSLPPVVQPQYLLFLGNDFLAPGTNDDYRTQQIAVNAHIGERVFAAFDLSIFTRDESPVNPEGRIDTATFSLGYKFVRRRSERSDFSLTAGIAIRSIGNFEGERIQNGFHRLTDSDLRTAPYTSTRSTDPGAWALAEYSRSVLEASDDGLLTGWDVGLWLRGGALGTTFGHFDGIAGAYVVLRRQGFDVWAGLRQDWRSGYGDDFVLEQTAVEENNAAFVWGLRWGALVLETTARQNSQASYGQLSFVSSAAARGKPVHAPARFDFQLSLQPPHMTFQAVYRHHVRRFFGDGGDWRESFFVEGRGGQPQLGRDPSRFVETYQLTAGYEIARTFSSPAWLAWYTNASLGARSERLSGRATLTGQSADAVESAVVAAEAGIEIDAARLSQHWLFRLRLGVSGWYPFSSESAQIGAEPSALLEPGASFVMGWAVSRLD